MKARWPLLSAVFAALCAASAIAYRACGRPEAPPPLATLTELRGEGVDRDYAGAREQWVAAELGDGFRVGDGLRTTPSSRALLAFVDGSMLEVDPDSTIRFLLDAAEDGEHGVDVLTGEAVLRVGRRGLSLRTHVGLAVIAAGSQLRLAREGAALSLRVEVGEARFRSASGEPITVNAGEEVRLEVGMAVLRPKGSASVPDAGAGEAAPPATEAAAATEGSSAEDDADVEPGPDYANLAVPAGGSFVVHAPEVPVAVAFDFAQKCPGEGVVEQGKQRGRGRGRGHLLLGAGARRYTVRCLDARGRPGRVVARGIVRVLRDAGTRRLPPKAPTSNVDADGRTYTIYYQNQLPNVRVRWPNPPSASRYRLEVDGKAIALDRPEHLFRSGRLLDGVHRLTFEAQGRRSRTAKVEIRFDNAAATASLSAPADRSFSPGDTVRIEGVALPSWKVAVQGGTIEKDGGDRFHGEVVTSAQHPDIAVRLSHPRLGTHYYLRRAVGSR